MPLSGLRITEGGLLIPSELSRLLFFALVFRLDF
jgi:hypothetical protein